MCARHGPTAGSHVPIRLLPAPPAAAGPAQQPAAGAACQPVGAVPAGPPVSAQVGVGWVAVGVGGRGAGVCFCGCGWVGWGGQGAGARRYSHVATGMPGRSALAGVSKHAHRVLLEVVCAQKSSRRRGPPPGAPPPCSSACRVLPCAADTPLCAAPTAMSWRCCCQRLAPAPR